MQSSLMKLQRQLGAGSSSGGSSAVVPGCKLQRALQPSKAQQVRCCATAEAQQQQQQQAAAAAVVTQAEASTSAPTQPATERRCVFSAVAGWQLWLCASPR